MHLTVAIHHVFLRHRYRALRNLAQHFPSAVGCPYRQTHLARYSR